MTLEINQNTIKYKIYQEYFVLNNTNINDIANKLNITMNNVSSTVSRLKKKLLAQESTGTITTSTNNGTTSTIMTQEIDLKLYENDQGKIILSVKTCPEFEKWMQENKEIRETLNLFGKNKKGKYYYLRVVDNYFDDINMPIVTHGKLNFSILRTVGISEGKEFELEGLLTQRMLELATKNLIKAFKDFYIKNILAQKINIQAEVILQK